jgi:nitrite reductase (NADH) small subunit
MDTECSVREISEDLVLVEVAGRKFLAAARCPHRQGKLKYAHVDGNRLRIKCPLHYSTFDLTSGERTSGPACDPLRIVDSLPGGSVAAASLPDGGRGGAAGVTLPDVGRGGVAEVGLPDGGRGGVTGVNPPDGGPRGDDGGEGLPAGRGVAPGSGPDTGRDAS